MSERKNTGRLRTMKLRNSARGRDCTLNIAGACNYTPATVVLCHIDSEEKGMGIKSPDWFAVFGCSDCHSALDGHEVEDRHFYINRALLRTWKVWIEEDIIKIGRRG